MFLLRAAVPEPLETEGREVAHALDGWIGYVVGTMKRIDAIRDVASRLDGEDAKTLWQAATDLENEFELRTWGMPHEYQELTRQTMTQYRAIHPGVAQPDHEVH